MYNRKLKYIEEKVLNEELRKIENAEKYLKNYSLFNSLAIMLFIMSFIMIITVSINKANLINVNESLISMFVMIFSILSLISLIISDFYNSKTINIVKKYYSKN